MPSPSSSYRCAALDVESAHWIPVVHGIECGHLIHSHWRHLQYPSYLVHDADACEAMLALAEVEQRHYSGFLVLAGIPRQHFLHELLILGIELEGNVEVVLRSVTVLLRS